MQIAHHLYAMFRVHKSNHFARDGANLKENRWREKNLPSSDDGIVLWERLSWTTEKLCKMKLKKSSEWKNREQNRLTVHSHYDNGVDDKSHHRHPKHTVHMSKVSTMRTSIVICGTTVETEQTRPRARPDNVPHKTQKSERFCRRCDARRRYRSNTHLPSSLGNRDERDEFVNRDFASLFLFQRNVENAIYYLFECMEYKR